LEYIKFRKFLVTRSADNVASPNLIVTMELPLSLTETPFQLLKTYRFNLPADNQQQHTSYISNGVNYIAYHPNSDYLLEFDEFPNIESDYYFLHRNTIVLKHKSQPTCTYALLTLSQEEILRLCTFVVEPNSAQPRMLQIDAGNLILNFIPSYELQTRGENAEQLEGSLICCISW